MTDPQDLAEGAAFRLTLGSGEERREIAGIAASGAPPAVLWLPGFRSDMASTKASAVAAWARRNGRACLRFDYSGHGISGGRFEAGTIGRWLEESLAVVRAKAQGRLLLVGSSMGGWIALLLARALAEAGEAGRLAGMALVAPAVDFTERLIWDRLPAEIRAELQTKGVWYLPSPYADQPYPITWRLIEEGRKHMLFDAPIRTFCPVHILQGMKDPDVPWQHAMTLIEHLMGDSATLTLIKDGDHRLSRDEDVARLIAAISDQ